MRQTGGALGGSWLRALDLDAGKFDGGYLGSNFQRLNPANTFWTKPGSPGPWALRTAPPRT